MACSSAIRTRRPEAGDAVKVPRRFLVPAGAARRLRVYLLALWKLFRHPETPRRRAGSRSVLGYAVSPIDLIPDFIPVLGQLDDLMIVPLGMALAVRIVPKPLWESRLREAEGSRRSCRS